MAILGFPSQQGIENYGIYHVNNIYWNLPVPSLVEQVIVRKEGVLANLGAVVVSTGKHTGRSPNDKFIVHQMDEDDSSIWWGKINHPIRKDQYQRLLSRIQAYLQGRDIFIQDLIAGADPKYRLPIRIISEKAWPCLFANDLFIRIPVQNITNHVPKFTIIHVPDFRGIPHMDGLFSDVFIVINFRENIILIGGTGYAGEIKKSIFTVLNYLLPPQGVLPMHCSANIGKKGDVALFFGLSGTGKTTLSSDPQRRLIGDDEHGWSPDGIFNFEGGCYAKTIQLKKELEPLIWEATQQFGTVLENVILSPNTGAPDFDDGRLTENTRAAYPIYYIQNHVKEGSGTHPKNIFFLTADAFGVMPPLSSLTLQQAMYYFLSGYTSKLAGTEKGITEPSATFSACFGAPFLPRPPKIYASMLGEKIAEHNVKVWLINTGWTGGPYGIGRRISLPFTRAMVNAVLQGELNNTPTWQDPVFGLNIPIRCPGIPNDLLDPRKTWSDPKAYDQQAHSLLQAYQENYQSLEV